MIALSVIATIATANGRGGPQANGLRQAVDHSAQSVSVHGCLEVLDLDENICESINGNQESAKIDCNISYGLWCEWDGNKCSMKADRTQAGICKEIQSKSQLGDSETIELCGKYHGCEWVGGEESDRQPQDEDCKCILKEPSSETGAEFCAEVNDNSSNNKPFLCANAYKTWCMWSCPI